MNTHVKIPRWFKLMIVLVPIVILIYLLSVNLLLDQEFNYFYNLGSENILFPAERISEALNGNYREINAQLIYFDVPIAYGSDKIDISVNFKNVFDENQKFILGARDQEDWHYLWSGLTIDPENIDRQTTTTSFNISEVYLNEGKLNIAFNIPHLEENKTTGLPVPIYWINITVHKPAKWRINEIFS